jgi:hypothetical protein
MRRGSSPPRRGLMVVDGTRSMTTMTENQSHVYLTVPKAMLGNALVAKPGLLRDGFCELPSEGLAGLLMANLVWIARQGEHLDGRSTAVAMKAAVDLAVGTLACAHADHDAPPDDRHDEAFTPPPAAISRSISATTNSRRRASRMPSAARGRISTGSSRSTSRRSARSSAPGVLSGRRRCWPPRKRCRSSGSPPHAALPALPPSRARFATGMA